MTGVRHSEQQIIALLKQLGRTDGGANASSRD